MEGFATGRATTTPAPMVRAAADDADDPLSIGAQLHLCGTWKGRQRSERSLEQGMGDRTAGKCHDCVRAVRRHAQATLGIGAQGEPMPPSHR